VDADRLVIVGVVLAELIQAGRTAKEAEATTSRLAGFRSFRSWRSWGLYL